MTKQEDYTELEILLDKIRFNEAKPRDYVRYEEILTKNGIGKEQISNILRRNGFTAFKQYYSHRQRVVTSDQRYLIEGAVLGTILGMGSALLLHWDLQQTARKTPSQPA
jgi:hypothetical protein